jgi:ATP-binding cassette subfamily A (ABC1) protein 3
VYPLFQLLGPRAKDKPDGGLPGYFVEGFLYLQYAIDRTLMRTILQSNPDELKEAESYNVKLQRFPYPAYTDDKYLFALQAFLPLLMLLSFIYPVINITKSIVYEKEKRLKESMKMMGLSNWLHWTAWFIKSYAFLMITCLIMTILIKVRKTLDNFRKSMIVVACGSINFIASFFWSQVRLTEDQSLPVVPYTDGTLIYFVLLVFSFSAVCFCFFVSAVFSRGKFCYDTSTHKPVSNNMF